MVGMVVVVAVMFSNSSFYQLLVEDDASIFISIFGGGDGDSDCKVEEHKFSPREESLLPFLHDGTIMVKLES